MSLFSGLFGNASSGSPEEAERLLADYLIPGETIELNYKLVRDYIIFTSHRLIIVDIQGIGKKKAFSSLPYRSISRFSVELAGSFDLDSELDIYISSATDPVYALQFRGDKLVKEVQQALAQAIL
ncbi:helicase [Aerococcus urinaehominis]|uniref:Helicase n=1 Tax=Aerococcus urinaehominis TaxID=128944 RepID=A0A0X8FLS2_9LACT|nr:PH domain-containing protein [Aerococcus urinaehominis]AMB99567.1 helicase [Aerococcus urinaehominis]SDM35416.1 PH domain-containing protein [Aerococcus urinaehominis]